MANRLRNAGFLELTSGYESNLALSLDASVRGAPGRAGLVAAGSVSSGGTVLTRNAVGNRPTITVGQTAEVSLLLAASVDGVPVTPFAEVVWVNAGEGDISTTPLTVSPVEYSAEGVGVRGLRQTFFRAWGRVVAPATTAKLMLQARMVAPSAGAAALTYLKPLIVTPTGAAHPHPWDPGTHTDTNLNLPAWPPLRPFRNPPQVTPIANRTGFQSASGINKTRLLYREPPVDLRGSVRCTPPELDVLDQFYRAGHDRFWIVRPDTDELCVATWLPDGAPKPSAHLGLTTIMDVGLQLTVA
ncbi:hypothetical protein KOAAANKH_00094 [Brevundimonas sp. NIBR10]|uniref:hypothetical protein n=1 Tax=Brevundimonas sp. NIBR10 TaxID=3015997 RepID=UPI0022F16E11|nr:hypothetical protein [Brevundimonas sp. NIBR10]WGM45233.1 hypothetical protein KOAAANKH_00094 [Brevundimonas sp. NIBR10]